MVCLITSWQKEGDKCWGMGPEYVSEILGHFLLGAGVNHQMKYSTAGDHQEGYNMPQASVNKARCPLGMQRQECMTGSSGVLSLGCLVNLLSAHQLPPSSRLLQELMGPNSSLCSHRSFIPSCFPASVWRVLWVPSLCYTFICDIKKALLTGRVVRPGIVIGTYSLHLYFSFIL